MPTRAAIALGSNLGDRRRAIETAVARLSVLLDNLQLSDIVETEPQGEGLESQPLYLNAVLVGDTTLTARELLDQLQAIEADLGRARPFRNAPRTIDLDLVLYGSEILLAADLEVPHPRFRERFFVLGPLAEIAPEMRDPVSGMRITELLRTLVRDESR